MLSRFKNLFSQDPDVRRLLPKPFEILPGITQTIRVIHTYTIEHAFTKPSQDKCMRICKHLGVFHSQSNQSIYIKKTAVDEVLFSGTPESKPEILPFEE